MVVTAATIIDVIAQSSIDAKDRPDTLKLRS